MTFDAELSNVVKSLASNDMRQARILAAALEPTSDLSLESLNRCVGIAAQLDLPHLALNALARMLEIDPGNKQTLNNIGVMQEQIGNISTAIEYYRMAIAKDERYISPLFNLANCLQRMHNYSEVAGLYHRILELDAHHDGALLNLGILALQSENIDEALHYFSAAAQARPRFFEATLNLGYTYCRARRYAEAADCYRQASLIAPQNPHLLNNQGLLSMALGDLSAAEEYFKHAITTVKRFDEAEHSLGLLYLSEFRLADGWRLYRKRPARRVTDIPLPDKKALIQGGTVTVVAEQGIGDELFFLRFLPRLIASGVDARYQASTKCGDLLKLCSNIPLIDTVFNVPVGNRLLVGDLPELLENQNAEGFPPPLVLRAEKKRVATYERMLFEYPRPWIGISWRAGEPGINTLDKRIPLAALINVLAGLPGTIVLLQRNPHSSEVEHFTKGLRHPVFDATAANDDLVSMTALLTLIDDYIAVSNTNTHVRAGLERPMRVLVPHPPDWRWGNELAATPWFPRAKIYRQTRDGGWNSALAALKHDMAYSVQN